MWIRHIILAVLGAGFGLFVSGGVFTTLTAVGLIPRFAGKTHTADRAFLYEEMVIIGTILGEVYSVFYYQIFSFFGKLTWFGEILFAGKSILIISGLFTGIFIGCLAIAIAELIDSIPIFSRRISIVKGMKAVILCIALGKLTGTLFDVLWL